MIKLLSSALVLLLAWGCGGDSFSAGEGGAGTVGEAGQPSGDAGESGSGNNGATSSGGNATAGSSSSGGRANGGSPQGGSPQGGSPQGGASGGGSSTGGTGAGGMPMAGSPSTASCLRDEDCVACAYETMPTTVLDCYCAGCADTPMNVTSCDENQQRWDKVCSAVDLACPAVKCLPPEPVRCEKGRCVDAQ